MQENIILKDDVDLENHKIIKSPQKNKLLENAEEVIELIENGKSYRFIANKYGVRLELLFWFVNHSEHSARAKLSLQIASYDLLDKAQNAIESIQDDSTNARVARQRELKNIYLYRAQIKNRKELDLNYREEKNETTQQIIVIPSDQALQLANKKNDTNTTSNSL